MHFSAQHHHQLQSMGSHPVGKGRVNEAFELIKKKFETKQIHRKRKISDLYKEYNLFCAHSSQVGYLLDLALNKALPTKTRVHRHDQN